MGERIVSAEEARGPCASCGEGCPRGECPKSQRECGHHCNHSWSHDGCCWCGTTFGEGGEETPAVVEAEDDVSKMQRVVYNALISGVKAALPDADLGRIDGTASDGDEFDFTEAEVSIALSMLDDALTEVRADLTAYRAFALRIAEIMAPPDAVDMVKRHLAVGDLDALAETVAETLDARAKNGRLAGLEEAAGVCEEWADRFNDSTACLACADYIRSLVPKEPK